MIIEPPLGFWKYGTPLRKKRGSHWRGRVVGYYSTENTPIGYAIESDFEPGSVQVWPADALEPWDQAELTRRNWQDGDDQKEPPR